MTKEKSNQIKKVLSQLLKYTEQLARSDENPDIDARALTRSCGRQLAVLRELMPPDIMRDTGAVDGEDRREIVEMLRLVEARTRYCIGTLETAKSRVERQMGSLRRSRRVITAYQGGR